MTRWTRRQFVTRSATAASGLGLAPGWVRAQGPVSDEQVRFLTPASAGYAAAATPFNQRIKTRPALIAACRSEVGVVRAVRYAIAQGLRIAVKSGGHSFEGLSLNDKGLVIDLSAMNGQRLDGRVYTAGPGIRLGDTYGYLLPRGRLLPAGSCGTVGLAGLTLGGGYGLFARRYGLTCDHLTGVRMVDGQGDVRDSDASRGLLKACRGGGNGNFGIVTQMRFSTRPAPTHLPRQRIKFRSLTASAAAGLCERWFTQSARLPNDAFSAFVLNGSTLTVLITSFDPASTPRVQAIAKAIAGAQGALAKPANEPIGRAVRRYYGADQPLHFKNVSAGYYKAYGDLKPGALEIFQRVIEGAGLIFQINTLGGAIDDPAKTEAAVYPHRGYPYLGELQCYWENDGQTEHRVQQVHAIQKQLAKIGIARHYRNYPGLEIDGWQTAYYGRESYAWLQACKRVFDPHDRIGHAQSIELGA